MGFPELAENREILLLHKYFVNFQSIGLHDIFTKKKTRQKAQSVVNNIFLVPKTLTHLCTARQCETNSTADTTTEVVGKSQALFITGRLEDEWHEVKGSKEVEEWPGRRWAGGETLVQRTEGKGETKREATRECEEHTQVQGTRTHNHSNQALHWTLSCPGYRGHLSDSPRPPDRHHIQGPFHSGTCFGPLR